MEIEQTQDLMKLIQIKFPRLSKGQKLIADFILISNFNFRLLIKL